MDGSAEHLRARELPTPSGQVCVLPGSTAGPEQPHGEASTLATRRGQCAPAPAAAPTGEPSAALALAARTGNRRQAGVAAKAGRLT